MIVKFRPLKGKQNTCQLVVFYFYFIIFASIFRDYSKVNEGIDNYI